jgi:hypothetical protein
MLYVKEEIIHLLFSFNCLLAAESALREVIHLFLADFIDCVTFACAFNRTFFAEIVFIFFRVIMNKLSSFFNMIFAKISNL